MRSVYVKLTCGSIRFLHEISGSGTFLEGAIAKLGIMLTQMSYL